MRKYFLVAFAFICFSFVGISLKKRISDTNFRYEFYTCDKQVALKENRKYFWFKGGAIHSSEYGMAGELLHDEFLKFYHNNQLAEAGKYKYGLKVGYWKTWYENGMLQSKTYFGEGQMDGSFYSYNVTGFLVEEGNYKNGLKHGRWINYISKDTLNYKKGYIIKKSKDTLSAGKSFFRRLFSTENKHTISKTKKEHPKSKSQDSFFKRLFSNKNKSDNKTGNEKKQSKNRLKTKKEDSNGKGS